MMALRLWSVDALGFYAVSPTIQAHGSQSEHFGNPTF
jgi:hypothetical protein